MARKVFRLTLAILCLVVPFNSVVYAASTLTNQQHQALGRGDLYFDTEEDQSCSTSTGTVGVAATGDHPKDAYNFFVANGFSTIQSAAIVGNLQVESSDSIDPTALNTQKGIHYGIAQWGGDRYTALKAFAASKGKDKADFQLQLDFIIHELNTSQSAAKRALQSSSTIEDAVNQWNLKYEVSGVDPTPRITKAKTVLAQYGGGDIGTITNAGVSGCISTSSPDCTTATGNAKILCNAQAYNGIYYQWGGGHAGYKAFVAACPDPSNPPNNQPTGGSDAHSGNPSPCGLDCSGLVSIAVSATFNTDKTWTVATMQTDTANWKEIPVKNVQSGDVVTKGSEHVEIVDRYDTASGKLYVFGAHQTGKKNSEIVTSLSDWTGGAYRYIGTGAQ